MDLCGPGPRAHVLGECTRERSERVPPPVGGRGASVVRLANSRSWRAGRSLSDVTVLLAVVPTC